MVIAVPERPNCIECTFFPPVLSRSPVKRNDNAIIRDVSNNEDNVLGEENQQREETPLEEQLDGVYVLRYEAGRSKTVEPRGENAKRKPKLIGSTVRKCTNFV